MIGRILKLLSFAFAIAFLLVGCHTREVAYLSDATRDSAQEILNVYTATILPGDELDIHVFSQTPESVYPFNRETRKFVAKTNHRRNVKTDYTKSSSQRDLDTTVYMKGFVVSQQGTIIYPELGTIDVVGLTYDSLSHYIERRLRDEGYVNDPQVTIDLVNFRVVVVGEVKSPQQIHADGTRLTIFEALAICHDITDYGRRDNVTIIRQEGGKREIGEIDLTKHEMLESPYYYLHNNDIVYVEPIDKKKIMSDRDPNVSKYVSIAVSVGNIINATLRTFERINRMNR